MHVPSPPELLNVWERGLALTPAQRALELLTSAWPHTRKEDLGRLSIGQRDARLFMLREALFGREMAAVATCPRCAERLELTFDTSHMHANLQEVPREALSLSVAGYDIDFRPPTTQDAIAAAEEQDALSSSRLLLRQCLLSVKRGDATVASEEVPPEVVEVMAHRMTQADVLADIQMTVSCPHCGYQWQSGFDIVSFLWSEIEAWAWRMLSDVHSLASAYGWNERDILALSPVRRQFYLQTVGG